MSERRERALLRGGLVLTLRFDSHESSRTWTCRADPRPPPWGADAPPPGPGFAAAIIVGVGALSHVATGNSGFQALGLISQLAPLSCSPSVASQEPPQPFFYVFVRLWLGQEVERVL